MNSGDHGAIVAARSILLLNCFALSEAGSLGETYTLLCRPSGTSAAGKVRLIGVSKTHDPINANLGPSILGFVWFFKHLMGDCSLPSCLLTIYMVEAPRSARSSYD